MIIKSCTMLPHSSCSRTLWPSLWRSFWLQDTTPLLVPCPLIIWCWLSVGIWPLLICSMMTVLRVALIMFWFCSVAHKVLKTQCFIFVVFLNHQFSNSLKRCRFFLSSSPLTTCLKKYLIQMLTSLICYLIHECNERVSALCVLMWSF